MANILPEGGIGSNFTGVIVAGLTLTKSLYDFAQVLESASQDVKSIATDVSLFCAVLKQLQYTLTRTRAYRLSPSAMESAQAIIDICQIIFDDLAAAVANLQRGKSNTDFVTRVKWYFKEKRVLLIHEQLHTCGARLHLMLNTLQLAQKIATNPKWSLIPSAELKPTGHRHSGANQYDDDSQDRLMTTSLLAAQQAATERLVAAENQLSDDDDTDNISFITQTPSVSLKPPDTWQTHRRNRSSQIINGLVHNPTASPSERIRPVSKLLASHVDCMSLIQCVRYSTLSGLDDHRLSILQTDELLRQWTDQVDPLADHEAEFDLESDGNNNIERGSFFTMEGNRVEQYQSPNAPEPFSPIESPNNANGDGKNEKSIDAPWKWKIPYRYRHGDTQDLLCSLGEPGDWRTWALMISCSNGEVELGPRNGHYDLFESLRARQEIPRLRLQKRAYPLKWSEADNFGHRRVWAMKIPGISYQDPAGKQQLEYLKKLSSASSIDFVAGVAVKHAFEKPRTAPPIPTGQGAIVYSLPEAPKLGDGVNRVPFGVLDLSYDKVLIVGLASHGGSADWREYDLYIVHDNLQYRVGLEEKPWEVFQKFAAQGKDPVFMARKRNGPPWSFPPGGLETVSTEGKGESTDEPPFPEDAMKRLIEDKCEFTMDMIKGHNAIHSISDLTQSSSNRLDGEGF